MSPAAAIVGSPTAATAGAVPGPTTPPTAGTISEKALTTTTTSRRLFIWCPSTTSRYDRPIRVWACGYRPGQERTSHQDRSGGHLVQRSTRAFAGGRILRLTVRSARAVSRRLTNDRVPGSAGSWAERGGGLDFVGHLSGPRLGTTSGSALALGVLVLVLSALAPG